MSYFQKYLEMAIGPDQLGSESDIETLVNTIEDLIDKQIKKHRRPDKDTITLDIDPSHFKLYKQLYKEKFEEINSILKTKYLNAGWSSFEGSILTDPVWGLHTFMGRYTLKK